MKITALCKTFQGDEFLEAMIRSIYAHVDNIVFVNSELSWTHSLKGNTQKGNSCKAVIKKMIGSDVDKKIHSLNYNTRDQFKQCEYGFKYIKNHLDSDWVMLIDTDEVWDDYNLTQAIKYLKKNEDPLYGYRARLYTYIKSPLYRVDPEEVMAPTIFVSTKRVDLGDNHRSCRLPLMAKMATDEGEAIFFHHFVYVRRNLQTILEKIRNSNGYEGNKIVDLDEWVEQVWEKIPQALTGKWKKGFHTAQNFQKHWQNILEINRDQLPEVFKKHPHLLEEYL